MAETRRVTLELTTEQEETIKALFAHNNWDFSEVQASGKRKRQSRLRVQAQGLNPDGGRHYPHEAILEGECEHCLQSPIITSRNLPWVGLGQEPCIENSSIRRDKYSKYWKAMSNVGAWNDPRYLQRKQEKANGGEWAVQHRREVMPTCILRQLRTLYPNPQDMPYMDHKWE